MQQDREALTCSDEYLTQPGYCVFNTVMKALSLAQLLVIGLRARYVRRYLESISLCYYVVVLCCSFAVHRVKIIC